VSVNQKMYLQQKAEFTCFEQEVDEFTNASISRIHNDLKEMLDLISEMFIEIDMIQEARESFFSSLKEREVRLSNVRTSIGDLTAEMAELVHLNSSNNSNRQSIADCISKIEEDTDQKNDELRALMEELTSLELAHTSMEHEIRVNESQAADQASSLHTLRADSDTDLCKLRDMTSTLRKKTQSQLADASANKKAHLKRLQDDIRSKMEATHALNRECDKATVDLSAQEKVIEDLGPQAEATAVLASAAREAKEVAAEKLRKGELELKEAQEQACVSEQLLTSRIESSKASISTFFELKKKVNAKEWEANKAKANVEQAVGKQLQTLTDIESHLLVVDVKLVAATQEKELKEKELVDVTSLVGTMECDIVEREAILNKLNNEDDILLEKRAALLETIRQLQESIRINEAEATVAATEKSHLEEEVLRLDELLQILNGQLLSESEALEEVEKATSTEEYLLTSDELIDAESAAEKQFLEWQHEEEGQKFEHQHAASLHEIQAQIEQLEGAGELFPQIAIDRNNEIASLKNLIAKTWESLKNDNISDLVSNIEKSIHDKSKEKVRVTYNSVNGYEHVFCTD